MTEKKPLPGEWWEFKERVRVVGSLSDGSTVGETVSGTVRVFRHDGWKHLPDCDSFEWQPQPVQSPDDWVTQDRVYDRPGIDQWRRVFDDIPDDWRWSSGDEARYMHGHTALSGRSVFEVRCRRKDLPVMQEETPIREYVRCFASWNSGRVYTETTKADPKDVELKHDGTGFYLAE